MYRIKLKNLKITIYLFELVLEIENFINMDGLTSLIQVCNFVVTVSNSYVHLSGALGKETYLI